ncbi:MAG TPA: hypothetical protein VHF89_08570 [Solirubrobacteraceae bacterium]|nr:hypothetical protein [Solirubrobacteraceae bacterium]
MARTIQNEALGWLGAMWRLIDMVKPVRTIDELVLVLSDLRAQPQGRPQSEPVIQQGQVEAARLAGRALESTGDPAAAEAAKQRVSVLEDLRSPLPEVDPLAGSLNRIARSGALPVTADPRLQPIANHSPFQVVGEALRGVATTVGGPVAGDDARREAYARLQGQKEALRAVADALGPELESAEEGGATEQVRRALEARIAATDAAAVALAASAQPAVRQTRPRVPTPAPPGPEAARTARRPRRRRIEIIPKRPEGGL